MAQLQLPHIDADALRERVRDVDLSRLADLGDEVRHSDLAESIRSLDLDALRRIDPAALRHVADGLNPPDVDLGALRDSAIVRRAQEALGRAPKPNAWDSLAMPPLSATIAAGAVIVVGGALLGGVVAWLFQPGKGDERRARLRRKLGRVVRKVKRTLRPA